MKTIIAGSRTLDLRHVKAAMDVCPFDVAEVVCGCCKGIDRNGWFWAQLNRKPVIYFPAWQDQYDWAVEHKAEDEVIVYPDGGYKRDKGNGYARNSAMADYAEALVAIPSAESRGTVHMIELAKKKGLLVFEWRVKT